MGTKGAPGEREGQQGRWQPGSCWPSWRRRSAWHLENGFQGKKSMPSNDLSRELGVEGPEMEG